MNVIQQKNHSLVSNEIYKRSKDFEKNTKEYFVIDENSSKWIF